MKHGMFDDITKPKSSAVPNTGNGYFELPAPTFIPQASFKILPNDTLLVGFDFTHGEDNKVMIIGHKEGEYLKIVNAFSGDEAYELYKKLIGAK